MEILKVENLRKVYGKGDSEVRALDGVSFTVNKGEFIAIIGASGSGKSTLLHLMGGLDRPTSGKVIINDMDIYNQNETSLSIFRRRNIGFIFQFFNLMPILNVEENEKVDKKYLDEIIKLIGLEDRKKHIPSELSGGQQQRVSIARALINKPSIVLADEPTGNLDSKNSKEVIELLKTTAKRYNQTLILITHDSRIAEQADRIITLSDGKIKSDVKLA